MGHEWEEKLFGCFSNIPVCLITTCLPGGICVIQSTAVNKATGRGIAIPYLLIFCLGFIGGALNRETIRKELHLDGSIISSLLTWCLCPGCAACQEYREVKGRKG